MQWLKICANGCEDGCPYEYKNLVYRVECKADLMSDALELLREQEPSGWISVEDRLPVRPPDVCGLPVRRQWYLVALESGAVLMLSYEFDEDRWQGVGTPVTHWMSLPQAPKEAIRDENC